MFETIKKFIKDQLTLANGNDYDSGKMMGWLGIAAFISLSVYEIGWNKGHFDPVGWGTGFGTVIAAIAANLLIKHKTEPQ